MVLLLVGRVTGGRAPHGARGLKCFQNHRAVDLGRRAPHGARGLKYNTSGVTCFKRLCRAPHGARGLKLGELVVPNGVDVVAPRTGRVD